jgi:general secretion pathway protein J
MRRSRGFTLIELMVAIAIMALLALMSWRGLDGMARAQAQNRARGDAVLTLQTTLTQWSADLDATVALAQIRAMDWDGRVLRLTRRSTDSATPMVYVVAWTLRGDAATGARWHRWQSPGITSRPDWQQAWDQAAAWAQDGSAQAQGADVALMPLVGWQLYYFRNNVWTPAISSDELGAATPEPDGVRLVLNLPPGPAIAGALVKDWVRPAASAPKS